MRLTTCLAAATLAIAGASHAAEFRTGQVVMGTVLQVTIIADGVRTARQAAELAIAEAKRWDAILTTWRPEGELAQLNKAAGGRAVSISPELRDALGRMVALSGDTTGAFDPAVGAEVAGWRSGKRITGIPVSIRSSLHLGPLSARLEKGTELDAGGVGKGMALDAIGDLLRQREVKAALLDFGGSSQLAIGAPPESPDGWTLAVTGLEEGSVHGTISLRDGSLSTSRTPSAEAHDTVILDPRNGKPVTSPRAVTVRHRHATAADAWSTALVVLGRDGIRGAEEAGIDLLFEDPGGVTKTEEFQLYGWRKKVVDNESQNR